MGVIEKVMGVILAFFILVMGPLVNSALSNDITMKRDAINDTNNLLDKVLNTGALSAQQLGDYQLALASHGGILDATVQRYQKIINPDGKGGTYVAYQLTTNINQWNDGDMCKISVEAVDYTGGQKILWSVLKLVEPQFKFSLGGTVHT